MNEMATFIHRLYLNHELYPNYPYLMSAAFTPIRLVSRDVEIDGYLLIGGPAIQWI